MEEQVIQEQYWITVDWGICVAMQCQRMAAMPWRWRNKRKMIESWWELLGQKWWAPSGFTSYELVSTACFRGYNYLITWRSFRTTALMKSSGLQLGRGKKLVNTVGIRSRIKITLLWTHYETTVAQVYWGKLHCNSCWGKAMSRNTENYLELTTFWCGLG